MENKDTQPKRRGIKPTAEVIQTRRNMDAFLPKVPTKPYSLCNANERALYDEFSRLVDAHRQAVRTWRATA